MAPHVISGKNGFGYLDIGIHMELPPGKLIHFGLMMILYQNVYSQDL